MAAPTVTTGTATRDIGFPGVSFTLNGTVNPNGSATSAWFEVGLTASYSFTTPSQPLGSGSITVPVTAQLFPPPNETVHYRLVAQSGDTISYGAGMTFTTPSNNANLSSLTLSSGTLSPAFTNDLGAFYANVPNTVTSLTVTPTAADPDVFHITVNGFHLTSGSTSPVVPLNVGSNTITINVTAEDQIMTRSYTITVTRAASSNADLSSLSMTNFGGGAHPGFLTPAFQSHITNYTFRVPNNTDSVLCSGTTADMNASVFPSFGFGGTGGFFSGSLTLFGQNSALAHINVYAQDFTIKTYNVEIIRQTVFETWASSSGLPTGAVPAGDNDGDGVSNLLEFALGTPPLGGSTNTMGVTNGVITRRGTPALLTQNVPNGIEHLALFSRRLNRVAEGLTYTVQFSADLSIWQDNTATPTVIAEDFEVQACTVPYPSLINGKEPLFFRVQVTTAP